MAASINPPCRHDRRARLRGHLFRDFGGWEPAAAVGPPGRLTAFGLHYATATDADLDFAWRSAWRRSSIFAARPTHPLPDRAAPGCCLGSSHGQPPTEGRAAASGQPRRAGLTTQTITERMIEVFIASSRTSRAIFRSSPTPSLRSPEADGRSSSTASRQGPHRPHRRLHPSRAGRLGGRHLRRLSAFQHGEPDRGAPARTRRIFRRELNGADAPLDLLAHVYRVEDYLTTAYKAIAERATARSTPIWRTASASRRRCGPASGRS